MINPINRDTITLTSDGSFEVKGKMRIDAVAVKSTGSLAAFKIGTTNGGSELLAPYVTSGNWDYFQINAYDTVDYIIYFGGITSSTDILIYTK